MHCWTAAIVCTVLGGALMSANSTPATTVPLAATHDRAAPSITGALSRTAASSAPGIPDRLAELRGARPPGLAAALAAPATVGTESATTRGEAARASRSTATRTAGPATAGRAGRTAGARPGTPGPGRSRPARRPASSAPPGRPPNRTRPPAGPATLAAGPANSGGVVGFALAQVGKAYAFGSTGPDAYDCSGLVVAAYRRIGLSLPRSTYALAGWGHPVSRADLRPGDLVFPSSGHVGIYIGGGRMVHASTERGGVKVSGIYAFAFARRP
ncbi:C40 family peptidase [Dactylosporangium sp. CA-092794]|uniref:C40 family peptidase n=1 Tax=Dactylosporangium sp. CA-092794 TaxID=3239929 RepID=UPI003D92BBF3